MSMQQLDLNLLKVFDAVYRLRNLSEVALEVNLTQPAISHALRRLRNSLGDRLFVRTANGLEPTPRSEQLVGPIRQALLLIEDTVYSTSQFRPIDCERQFRLLLSDVGELVFLPRLLQHLRQNAPGTTVITLQAARTRYDAMLRDREADMAIGSLPHLGASLKNRALFKDGYVVMRALDPKARPRRITLAQYTQAAHVEVDPPGSITRPVEEALTKLKLTRRVVLRVPHYFAVPSILLNTDLMVTVPRSVARNIRSADGLQISDVPFEMPKLEVNMFWHLRQDKDPVHRWLRQTMADLFSS